MPIATGHEREELEAELEVRLFFTIPFIYYYYYFFVESQLLFALLF